MPSISIRKASGAADTKFIIACFDNSLPFLASIGSGAQWGAELFSEKPMFCKSIENSVESSPDLATGMAWIADAETGEKTVPAGAIVLSTDPPSYAPPQSIATPVPEIYIRILITDRTLGDASKGVGSKLLDFARATAQQEGISMLRVDCWKGGDDALMRYG